MSTYEAKKQARIERYRQYAENASERSTAQYDRFRSIADRIPMGQPILVGHHSERGHRADIKRIDNAMGKSVKESRKAEYWESRADNAESSMNIDSDDPEAIQKLKAKLDNMVKSAELMKAANKVIKNKKLSNSGKLEKLAELGIKEPQKLLAPDFAGRIGFPSYVFSNLNGNKKRIEDRIRVLESATSFESFEINGVRVELNDGQIQVHFPCKPDESVRSRLKSCPLSLKWSRYSMAWVRKYTANTDKYFIQYLKELLGSIQE